MTINLRKTIEIAIATERASEALYLGLQAKFVQHAPLAAFWEQYAFEEARHAEWLEGLKAKLDKDTLDSLVDPSVEYMLREVAGFSVKQALQRVQTLEDAYQLVLNLESNETNAIFQFLLDNFEPDEEMRTFLRMQLEKHVDKLMLDFPMEYRGSVKRKSIRALEG